MDFHNLKSTLPNHQLKNLFSFTPNSLPITMENIHHTTPHHTTPQTYNWQPANWKTTIAYMQVQVTEKLEGTQLGKNKCQEEVKNSIS